MRFIKWLTVLILLPVFPLATVAMALGYWVNTGDFRGRVEREATAALGVPVALGGVQMDVWPLPAVTLTGVHVKSQPPLTLERVEARPVWAGLLRGRLEVSTLIIRKAVVPQQAVTAIAGLLQKAERLGSDGRGLQAEKPRDASYWPRRVVLEEVTWVDAKGQATTADARAQLDDDGLLDTADAKILKGRFEGAHLRVQREQPHWGVRLEIGGGTVTGKVELKPGARAGATQLTGTLDTSAVALAALTAPSRTLTGKLDGKTTLGAEFRDVGGLAEELQTQTRFTVREAVVHGIDLERAVKTVGLSRGGQTKLDTLAGQIATQGKAAQLTNLVASSGLLTANGNVAMAPNHTLSGRVTVDLAAGAVGAAVGVPLVVGGTLDAPTVTLTRGALVGAAIGTVLAPGVGTGAGAKLGDKLGEGLRGLFGK